MDYIEISARTLDDAITKACIELGTSSDNLDYKVISEGSTGFLGLGSKPAIIKARRMAPTVEESVMSDVTEEKDTVKEAVKEVKETVETEKKQEPVIQADKEVVETSVTEEKPVEEVSPIKPERVVTPKTEEEVAKMQSDAKQFLEGVFKAMNLEVTMSMNYNQEDGSLDVDFEGPEMGILIGKRGQTLDSLQYLTSLVVNKEQNEYIRIKLDTENYRNRRKDTLENLAKNIAFKVKKTRKSVALEPMNPYERRIIHSALQNNKFVKTVSEGEEPFRHVVVVLKK